MIKHILCATAMFAAATTAHAGDPFTAPVTAELLSGWQQADGTKVSAIRLTLEKGWKTYWRVPGDAGIPPQFDWSGSRNLQDVSIRWPAPKVFVQSGMRSVGYANEVTLPLMIDAKRPNRPVKINLQMDIGVCKDICVPQRLTLKGTVDPQSTTPTPAIAAALAERPYTAGEAGAATTTCALTPTTDGLSITATLTLPSTGASEHVVIEAGRSDVWMSEASSRRSGNTLTAQAEMVPTTPGALALNRSEMRFTVVGSNHTVDLRGCTPG
ncbi:protein-disulfide reductase DsbD domain-containing protein [Sulfitobacter sp. HNIBRBA2951]|uniref:protein-disulfide reductase DsbD domain-containing protein n=1 Tax=Sulfitobacter aquimarinus TaxID=3158557 RepID=UPI0032E02DCC